jgi:hypothetical protein
MPDKRDVLVEFEYKLEELLRECSKKGVQLYEVFSIMDVVKFKYNMRLYEITQKENKSG